LDEAIDLMRFKDEKEILGKAKRMILEMAPDQRV